jgi:molecular chaperone HscA
LHATRESLAREGGLLEADESSRVHAAVATLERARGGEDYVAIRDAVDALSHETEPFARRIMDRSLQEALANRRLEEL